MDYSKPNPEIIERVKSATDGELASYLENARRKLPATQWMVDAVVAEQLRRGGLRNMTPQSVREAILTFARQGKICTYKDIAEALKVTWEQAHWRLPKLLGQVLREGHASGRPLLTAIVVSQRGVCGSGFFELARQLGYTVRDEQAFQDEQQQRVFEHWTDRR